MKRVGGLFDRIAKWSTVAEAFCRAARGKRARPEVQAFMRDSERHRGQLIQELLAGDYRFSGYRAFPVRDTKTREIHAPSFRDRVVHHAIISVIGPILERGALEHSYACRQGRGHHAALRQARLWTRRGDWYGKMDVAKFYDSVDHASLRALLRRRFREGRLLALLNGLLASYETSPGKGLPIGALTSQYFGNFLLDQVDHRIKATGVAQRYLRYMDDMVAWGSPDALSEVRAAAEHALADLNLRLKHGGEWNRCHQGVPMLGFVVYPNRLRLGKAGRRRLRRKTKTLEKAWEKGHIDEETLQHRGQALWAHACHGDDAAWRRTVLQFSRYD